MFLSIAGYCQEQTYESSYFIKNLNSLYQDPEQTIKVANYFLSNSDVDVDKSKALYLLSESNEILGNYKQSIDDLYAAKNKVESNSYLAALISIAIAERCRTYGMDDISTNYLEEAELHIQHISDVQERKIVELKLLQERASGMLRLEKLNDALKASKQSDAYAKEVKEILPALYSETKNKTAQIYLLSNQIDSAKRYFNEALNILEKYELEGSSMAAITLNGLGTVYFEEGQFTESKEVLKKALQKKIIEGKVKADILSNLSQAYKVLDSTAAYQKYYTESSLLLASLLKEERNVRNTLVSYVEEDQKSLMKKDMKTYYILGGIILGILILIILGYVLYNRKLNTEFRQFEKIIKQIENKQKLEMPLAEIVAVKQEPKGITIPLETENAILERLENFEMSTKFTNANMSVALLAKQMKTNTKYISEIIHTHKNKNFNTYINELRINYIIQLMQEDPKYLNYKVSYLAEKCGFSSHSAFTVVFKSITRITPKQFVAFIKKSSKVAP